jgi:hypothetical protein
MSSKWQKHFFEKKAFVMPAITAGLTFLDVAERKKRVKLNPANTVGSTGQYGDQFQSSTPRVPNRSIFK